jgi:glycosyltransferase involved in cell wall biosynthesis
MRILYFTRDYTTHDHRFLTALAGTEHQIYYLRLEKRGHNLEERALPANIKGVSWAGGQHPARFIDGPRLLAALKKVIRTVNPDLIQAGPLQRSALLAALSGFTPLVSMSWGYDLIHDAQRNAAWRWATRYTLKHSSVMIGDCDTIRQLAISYGMPDERIVTFPWGIDLNHFNYQPPEPTRVNGEPFVLLSTRGWEPIYGVNIIAKAFVKAAQKYSALQLVMLGDGSLASQLRQIFTQGGVLDRVTFPGQVGQADLPAYYHQADLYVTGSHSDGTSISLLEALACGRPVVVSDIPGNREWVQSGVQGWLYPEGDDDALAQAISQAFETRRTSQRMSQMGRAARELAEQRANWDNNFQQMLKAYQVAQRYRR